MVHRTSGGAISFAMRNTTIMQPTSRALEECYAETPAPPLAAKQPLKTQLLFLECTLTCCTNIGNAVSTGLTFLANGDCEIMGPLSRALHWCCAGGPAPSSLVAAQMSSCCCWGKFLTACTIMEELPTPAPPVHTACTNTVHFVGAACAMLQALLCQKLQVQCWLAEKWYISATNSSHTLHEHSA